MRRSIVALVVLSFACPSEAAGLRLWDWLTQYKQPNIHWGQLALHPYYHLTEMYDSNIYLVPRDQPNGVIVGGGRRESWITKNNVGLETDLPIHRLHDFKAGYDFESQNYSTQPQTNDTINQKAHLDYSYSGAYGITVKAGDKFENTTDQAFSELIARNRRWMNLAYADLDYNPQGGRLAGGFDAFDKRDKYVDTTLGGLLDRYEERAGFNFGYKVQPKTKAYFAYHYDVIHYSVPTPAGTFEKDSHSQIFGTGVTGQLAPKLEGQVEASYTQRLYSVAAVNGTSRIKNMPTVDTSVTYKPDQYTVIKLDLNRTPQETIDPANQFYVESAASLDARHQFPYKFKAGLTGTIAVDKYENNQAGGPQGIRRDDIYMGGAWIEYDIQKWLSTGISYLYRQRDSTFSGQFNYEDNQVAWDAALKF